MRTATFRVLLLAVALGLFSSLALRGQDKQSDSDGWTTEFFEQKSDLVSVGRNPFFILEPGHYLVLEHGSERLKITVLNETKTIDGVETRVVEENETKDGKPVEISRNYFVISKRTNSVYYFGEDVDVYKDGKVTGHPGVWHSGVKGAKYGLMMPGTPLVKGKYYQEIAPGTAMDRAQIVSVNETLVTPAGTFKNCLKTLETTPLEPDTKDTKVYAPGIGLIQDGHLKLTAHGRLERSAQ